MADCRCSGFVGWSRFFSDLFPNAFPSNQEMKFPVAVYSLLVLAMVLAWAAGNDLDALKATIQSLCTANKNGAFGTCCVDNNDGQEITEIRGLPSCFGTVQTATSFDEISALFVSGAACSFSMDLGIVLVTSKAKD